MERFYTDQEISNNNMEISTPEIVYKIGTVLRMKTGDQFRIFGNNYKEFLAEISAISKKSVSLKLIEEIKNSSEPIVEIILHPALIKKNRFETILEKCTEIGVVKFAPIISERSVVKTEEPPERWEKIIIEAVQQSGRIKIPPIAEPQNLSACLKEIAAQKHSAQIIIALEGKNAINARQQIKKLDPKKPVHIFVGPEGGWSPEEIQLLLASGAQQVHFGSRILRAETACIVISAFCVYSLEEWGEDR